MDRSEVAKLLSTGGGAAAAIGGAYKFAEFLHKAKRLRDVGPSNAVYVRLINRVRADLDEVRRLLTVREVHDALEANPEKAKWVYGAMRDVRGSLENITPHTERVAGDIEGGHRVGLRHRVYWLVSEKEKLENREKELAIAHASLTEVLGYLAPLEPIESAHHRKHLGDRVDKVDIDIDIRRDGPERVEREVWVERDDPGPRRVVEERGVYTEHERHKHHRPRRIEEHYEVHDHRGPGRYEERDVLIDERGPRRYDQREVYAEQGRDSRYDGRYVDERELHVERDPRDPRHVEARYSERGPGRYEEKRYEERRFNEPLERRAESFEDRVSQRETWMESAARRPRPQQREQYDDYAEYGAPQPYGAANYRRKFEGDAGFGDDEVTNPQVVPPNKSFEREVWIEQKEDYRYDKYGNRLPDRYFPHILPRSRM